MFARLFNFILQDQTGLSKDDSTHVRSLRPFPENSTLASVKVTSSAMLNNFIEACRKNLDKNAELSNHYDPKKYLLFCPFLNDFPLTPVRFNGRLYDYDSLMAASQNGKITDHLTGETIELSAHTIQPDFDAQSRMDELYLKITAPSVGIKR